MQTAADLKYPDFQHNLPSFSSSPKNYEGTRKMLENTQFNISKQIV